LGRCFQDRIAALSGDLFNIQGAVGSGVVAHLRFVGWLN
jgi:hypothetical protein